MNFEHVNLEEFLKAIEFMEDSAEVQKTRGIIFNHWRDLVIGWDPKYRKKKRIPFYLNMPNNFTIGIVKRNILIHGKYVFKLNKVVIEWMKQCAV